MHHHTSASLLTRAGLLALTLLAGAAGLASPALAQGYLREPCTSGGFVNSWTTLGYLADGTRASTGLTLGATTSNRPYAFLDATGDPGAGGVAFAVALAPGVNDRARIRAEVNGAREVSPAGMPGLTLAFNESTGACLLGLLDISMGSITIAQKASSGAAAVVLANGIVPQFEFAEDYKLDFSISGTTVTLRAVKDGVVLRSIQANNVTFSAGKAGFAVIARESQSRSLRGTFRDVVFNRTVRGDRRNRGQSSVYWHDRSSTSQTRGMMLVWDVARTSTGPLIDGFAYDDRGGSRLDPSEYSVLGTGDITGDGRDDIFVRRLSDNSVRVRFVAPLGEDNIFRLTDDSNGFQPSFFTPAGSGWATIGQAPANWAPVGVGDMNGDGIPDIVWRNTTTGANGLWLLDASGAITWREIEGVSDSSWQVQAVADFDDDGTCDLLWKNSSTGLVANWLMNDDSSIRSFQPINFASGWSVVGVGDFDDNPSSSDIMWMNDTTGVVGCWNMQSSSSIRSWKGITSIEASRWQGRN
jgi:hypothetical protein